MGSSPYTVNYQFNAQSGYAATSDTSTLTVTPLALTATINASNKVYDSTTAAIVTPSLSGVINGDSVTLVDGTSTFASQNVGTWLVTDTGITLSGADMDNYTVNNSATDTAKITREPLTITAVFNSKTYDATTSRVDLADDHVGKPARLRHSRLHREVWLKGRGYGREVDSERGDGRRQRRQ